MGHSFSDPRELRVFEEDEHLLVQEGDGFSRDNFWSWFTYVNREDAGR